MSELSTSEQMQRARELRQEELQEELVGIQQISDIPSPPVGYGKVYERKRDKVCLVGMARTSRYDAPVDDDSYEIWALNESEDLFKKDKKNRSAKGRRGFLEDKDGNFRCDLVFQLHPYFEFSSPDNFNDKNNWRYLQEEHPYSTMMQEQYLEVPSAVKYPLEEIIKELGPYARYFTSSFTYMVALAIYLGYGTIKVCGFEMSAEEEYEAQKPCGEFWLGIALGKGITLELPDECNLLGSKRLLYGYEMTTGIHLMHLEIMKNNYKRAEAKTQAELQKSLGEREQLVKELRKVSAYKTQRKAVQKKLDFLGGKQQQMLAKLNFVKGSRMAIENILLETVGRKLMSRQFVAPVILSDTEDIRKEREAEALKKKAMKEAIANDSGKRKRKHG